jgi:hypothetical protein
VTLFTEGWGKFGIRHAPDISAEEVGTDGSRGSVHTCFVPWSERGHDGDG